jgi:hypothetical protein
MIYKRGEVFWIKYYSGGKPIRESAGTTKQKQAERFLKDRVGSLPDDGQRRSAVMS